MDIAALSMVLSQTKVKESAGIMIMDKVMDVAKQNGDAINQLVADSTENLTASHLGRIVDKYA